MPQYSKSSANITGQPKARQLTSPYVGLALGKFKETCSGMPNSAWFLGSIYIYQYNIKLIL
jgi:hypothetical protein